MSSSWPTNNSSRNFSDSSKGSVSMAIAAMAIELQWLRFDSWNSLCQTKPLATNSWTIRHEPVLVTKYFHKVTWSYKLTAKAEQFRNRFFSHQRPSSIAVYEIGIISLCVLYKLPRFVELRWRPVTSIRCISINWSKTANGISTPLGSWPWSTSGSKSHVKTLLAGCITLGIVSVSRSARSWAGTHGPNKSRTFFFLPARKFISGDCSGWYQANLVNTMSGHRCLSPQNQVQTKLARNPIATETQAILFTLMLHGTHHHAQHDWQAIFASNNAKIARLHIGFLRSHGGFSCASHCHQWILGHLADVCTHRNCIINIFRYHRPSMVTGHHLLGWTQVSRSHVWQHCVLGCCLSPAFRKDWNKKSAFVCIFSKYLRMGQDPSLLSHKTGAPQVGPVGVRQRQLSCFPEQLRHIWLWLWPWIFRSINDQFN